MPYIPGSYDPHSADQSIRADRVLLNPRFWRVSKALWHFTVATWLDKPEVAAGASERRRRKAKQLTNTLVELGATFIKLGQFLSVRRDFLPVELADELALLQDRVPPFDLSLVRETIRLELGAFPEELFTNFDDEPLASASIGQVHRATLKDGRQIVIKVQRPNLAQLLYQDLGYMRCFVKMAKFVRLKGDWDTWLELADEFGRVLFTEIDYIKEGRNADRMRYSLRDRSEIVIAKVFWKYTGRRVLTLEYLTGIKIDNVPELLAAKIDLDRLGKQLIDCYIDQVLNHGFFHADPHAGNLAVASDNRVILYDFGMMGEISQSQRDSICGCIAAVVDQDTSLLAKHLMALGAIRKTANLSPIERTLRPFIDYYSGKSILELDFSHLEKDIDQIAAERALRLPPDLAYLIRTGVALEGVARTLKPDFSFVDAAKPALKKWIMNQPAEVASILKALYRKQIRSQEVFPALGNGKTDPTVKVNDLPPVINVKTLDNQISRSNQVGNKISFLALLQLTLNLLVLIINMSCNQDSHSNIFLIGNGLIGALILWLLAQPNRLTKSRAGTIEGGNG